MTWNLRLKKNPFGKKSVNWVNIIDFRRNRQWTSKTWILYREILDLGCPLFLEIEKIPEKSLGKFKCVPLLNILIFQLLFPSLNSLGSAVKVFLNLSSLVCQWCLELLEMNMYESISITSWNIFLASVNPVCCNRKYYIAVSCLGEWHRNTTATKFT